jgi:hypothetical protein
MHHDPLKNKKPIIDVLQNDTDFDDDSSRLNKSHFLNL